MPIQPGTYRVAAQINVNNGTILPIYSFTLDLNGYNLVTSFEVRTPIWSLDAAPKKKAAIDHCKLMQAACDVGKGYPVQLQVSYEAVSPTNTTSQRPTAFLTLETGNVDEIQLDFGANEQTFICRSAGALIQEARVQGSGFPKFALGSQLIAYFMAQYAPGVSMTIIPSLLPAGHSFTEVDYTKTARGQSVFDYVTQAAQDDGYILTLHNNKGYYGPPGMYPGAPTVNLAWGRDLIDCKVDHAARRTRNIQVVVTGINQRKQARILAQYPPMAAATTEKVFIDAKHNHTKASLLAFAQQQYYEICSKEFVVQADLIPDPAFLKILATYGPHFYARLSGMLPSINTPLYHCRQAHVEYDGLDDAPSIKVALTVENHAPSITGG